MITAQFTYATPSRLSEAMDLLAADGSAALAGGQSLITDMKLGEAAPSVVVDLRKIGSLRGIEHGPDGTIRIAAMTTLAEIGKDRKAPAALTEASAIADPAIRNRATIGGNLVVSQHGSDLAPALLALGARVSVVNSQGAFSIPLDQYLAHPTGTLLTSVEVPAPRAGGTCVTERFAARPGHRPLMTVAVWAGLADDGPIAQCRVALSAAPSRPRRLNGLEQALAGTSAAPESVAQACQGLSAADFPSDWAASGEYRAHLAGVLVGRAFRRIQAR